MLIILVIIFLRLTNLGNKELLIWLPGVIGLTIVLFIEVNETIMIAKYYTGLVALTYALVSSAYMVKIDRNKKFSAYYSFGSIFLGLSTIFTIHFGGVVDSVLTKPLFLSVMLISLLLIIVSVIVLVFTKLNFQLLWGMLGWVIVASSILIQWLSSTVELYTKLILLVGILFLAKEFIIVNKLKFKETRT